MLHRASSDAGTRLRRSKSASTVQRVAAPALESLDPETAHQHALAAAATAYVKAYGREMPAWDKNRLLDLSRSKHHPTRTSTEGRHFPPRESSFRSTTSQKSSQRPRSSHQSTVPAPGTATSLPSYTSVVDRMSAQQTAPTTVDENARPSSQPKPYRAHMMSSIASQQIRKARSMYYASSVQTGSPIARPPAKYLTTAPVVPLVPHNPVQEPSPSTGISSLTSPPPPVSASTNHDTINKARDKVLQDFQQRPVRHTPSLFLAPFKKRHEKTKNKATQAQSTRESSCNSSTPVDSLLEAAIADFKPPKEKRSFSNSLKKRFKKVFGRTSSSSTTVPVQQVEASRDYFSVKLSHPRLPDSLDIPSPDDQILARVRSRPPSMEAGLLNRVRPSSGCSSQSDVDTSIATMSRVTSWTTSSAGNTVTSRDMNRLSVIHEAKDSLASELNPPVMASPKRKPLPIPTFAAFREPMPIDGLTEGASTPVDPKRVFSALMKEIGSTQAVHPSTAPPLSTAAVPDVFTTAPLESLPASPKAVSVGAAEEDKSETLNTGSLQAAKSTIRTVTPEPEQDTLDRATSIRGAVRIPKPDAGDSASDSEVQDDNFSITQHTDKPRYRFNRDLLPTKAVNPTPEQIKRRVELSRNRYKVPAEGSPFSPSRSSPKTSEVTGTPQSLLDNPAGSTSAFESTPGFTTSTPIKDSLLDTSTSPKPRTLFSPLSPSVYSRNTDGVSILPSDSVGSLNQSGLEEAGTAVIITSRPVNVKSYTIGMPSPRDRSHSNRSSKDWKAWLSHEVSELGSHPQEDITINSLYVGSGHHREATIISEDDDTEVENSFTPPILEETGETRSHRTTTSVVSVQPQVADEVKSHRATAPTISALPQVEENLPQQAIDPPVAATPPVASASEKSEASPKPSEDSSPCRKPHHSGQSQSSRPRLPLRSYCSSTSSDGRRSARFSSMSSDRPSIYRPRLDAAAVPLERMNERFPYIETGRRLSQTSSRTAKTNRTASTESPPLRSTPSPQVYSDFSGPPSLDAARNKLISGSLENIVENDKENRKVSRNSASVDSLTVPANLPRPKSLQVMTPSSWNKDAGSPTHARVSAHRDPLKSSSVSGITPPRHRLRPSNLSFRNLPVRPKSVFDLRPTRGAGTPPPAIHGSSKLGPSPSKGASSPTRIPMTIRKVENDDYAFPMTSPPRSSHKLATAPRSVHMKRPSSTLALNKEPSPGLEERGIDAIIESEEVELPKKVGGTPTAGQKMAERFLRERKSGSLAGSPTRQTSMAFL